MAQANSVQREPSMEEILASIRRIIEDNDSGRRPSVDFGQVKPDNEDEPAERNVIEVEAFRAELQTPKATPVEAKPEILKPELPKAEFAKADIPADKPLQPERVEAVAPAWSTIEAKKPPLAEPVAPRPEPVPVRAPAASWAPASTIAVEQMERLAGPAPAAAPEREPAPVAKPVVEALAPLEAAVRPAIISEQAGKQVSAAFGELNDAYAARSRKSFDEIAAEMMKPMLQDWLDNNLPTLVEKLVREEIERIARGSQ